MENISERKLPKNILHLSIYVYFCTGSSNRSIWFYETKSLLPRCSFSLE